MSTLYLVGAGPGDPDLITVKAVKALQKADVVLFDALASEELLNYCKSSAVKEYVGKRYGCHQLSQQEINYRITEYGQQYEHIVRLKGGDPGVFGRACEEKEAALQAGMKVEMVPGISSALSVPVLADIPLTSRGVSESFWVTTGTTKDGQISNDVSLAAQSTATVIILMAMSKLEAIMDIFAQNGKSETPVAIIQNGTLPTQKIVIGKVKDIAFKAQFEGLGNPAIIIVGEVVNKKTMLHQVIVKQTSKVQSVIL